MDKPTNPNDRTPRDIRLKAGATLEQMAALAGCSLATWKRQEARAYCEPAPLFDRMMAIDWLVDHGCAPGFDAWRRKRELSPELQELAETRNHWTRTARLGALWLKSFELSQTERARRDLTGGRTAGQNGGGQAPENL